MYHLTTSVYLRVEFDVADRSLLEALTLRMKYDDGFAAYLNGSQVASALAPAPLVWNSEAAGQHDDDAVTFETFDITDSIGALRNGSNVLAIHGLSRGIDSSDMLILSELVAREAPEDPDDPGDPGGAIFLDRTTRICARANAVDEWSALNDALYVIDTSSLRITELMYNPPPGFIESPYDNDDFEFTELMNTGDSPLNLQGVRFTSGVDFTFPELADPAGDLQPLEAVLLVRNHEAFASRHDTTGL